MILVLLPDDLGAIEESAFQGLTAARNLGDDLHAVVFGGSPYGLGDYGVGQVHRISHEGLVDYNPTAWGTALSQLVESIGASAVVGTGTDRGNEVIAHAAAVMDVPFVANCVEIDPSGDTWQITRTRWGGSLLEETSLEAAVKLVSITEHTVEPSPAEVATSPDVADFAPELSDGDLMTGVIDRVTTAEGITLATAPVVVSGGRGVGSPEGFDPLEELASLLGGVVGCSRVVTNNGWRPHSDQVGQTGTVIAPDLYIACGISGAIQHWVGMMASKTILAINTDKESPMVMKADYAIVGDLHEIVPAVVEELKKRQSG